MATAAQKQSSSKKTSDGKQQVIAALQKAFCMEMETVANYLADSINMDGVRAEEIKKSLGGDIQEELGHAQKLAQRIKQLNGMVPGASQLDLTHSHLDDPSQVTDVKRVIQAVIDDERAAIEHYQQIIRDTDGQDYVTQDLCIQLLADEEEHLTQFEGFLKEYNNE